MAGKAHKTDQQRAELAEAARTARRGGTPWKVIANLFNLSPRQLQRYAAADEPANVASFSCHDTNVAS